MGSIRGQPHMYDLAPLGQSGIRKCRDVQFPFEFSVFKNKNKHRQKIQGQVQSAFTSKVQDMFLAELECPF